ncbi:hypothetical protein ZWY2020_052586 [Hordeum vulgare]|nr:hypothetical protein ZWY2020_052586 [Hordeum vulgare]
MTEGIGVEGGREVVAAAPKDVDVGHRGSAVCEAEEGVVVEGRGGREEVGESKAVAMDGRWGQDLGRVLSKVINKYNFHNFLELVPEVRELVNDFYARCLMALALVRNEFYDVRNKLQTMMQTVEKEIKQKRKKNTWRGMGGGACGGRAARAGAISGRLLCEGRGASAGRGICGVGADAGRGGGGGARGGAVRWCRRGSWR